MRSLLLRSTQNVSIFYANEVCLWYERPRLLKTSRFPGSSVNFGGNCSRPVVSIFSPTTTRRNVPNSEQVFTKLLKYFPNQWTIRDQKQEICTTNSPSHSAPERKRGSYFPSSHIWNTPTSSYKKFSSNVVSATILKQHSFLWIMS